MMGCSLSEPDALRLDPNEYLPRLTHRTARATLRLHLLLLIKTTRSLRPGARAW